MATEIRFITFDFYTGAHNTGISDFGLIFILPVSGCWTDKKAFLIREMKRELQSCYYN